MTSGFDALLAEIGERIAAGEIIDPMTLPPGFAADPRGQSLLRFARVDGALAANVSSVPVPPPPDTARPVVRIGPWRLARLLGSGGMGDVWLGERSDGTVEHRVAIKRVRGGTPAFAQRLEAERRILARLSHPNIARFIDAGVDATGAPWLALEYIDGETLNAWCEGVRPSLAERLALFLAICAAVEHAHRHLVVHRDLKPANVLVDAAGMPHLLDFGVAKLLDGSGGELTAAALTPAYAAPEQLRGGELSTATDVYALGLLLFRLLAGDLPPTRRDAGVAQVLARLDEEETQQPSATARQHAGQLPYAPTLVEGDLDAIVSKAIRAAPEARYGSVVELAADVRRHLESRPVTARAPTRGYLFARWVRRNALAVGLGSAAAVALLAGAAVALWQAERARASAAAALSEAARAERVQRFVLSVFSEYDPVARASAEANPRALVAEGIARAERELVEDPALQRAVLLDLSRLEVALGDPRAAVARLTAIEASMDASDALAQARARVALAQALLQDGQLAEADRVLALALPVLVERLPDHDLERLRAEFMVGRIGNNIGRTAPSIELGAAVHARTAAAHGPTHSEAVAQLVALGSWQTAGAAFTDGQRSLETAVELIRTSRGDTHASLAFALMQLGNNFRRQNRYAEALPLLERANRLYAALLPVEHPLIVGGLLRYGDTLRSAGRFDEAVATFDAAGRLVRPDTSDAAQLAMFRGQLAGRRGDHAEAARQFDAAFVVFRRIAGEKSPMTWGARGEQGRALLNGGDVSAAAPVIEETFAMRRAHMAPDSLDVALSLTAMASLRARQGRSAEALDFWREALVRHEAIYGAGHARCVQIRLEIIELLAAHADPARASQAREEADRLLALADGIEARALSASIALRAGDAARAGEDLARARELATATAGADMTPRSRRWLETGVPIAPGAKASP
ncbi:MAG: protein kinase domain-containing protein [Pseudomonadota bacterium]